MIEAVPLFVKRRRTAALACIALVMAVIPLWEVVSPIVVLICIGSAAVRAMELGGKIEKHPVWINHAGALAVMAAIGIGFASHGFRHYLVSACVNLLVGGTALKFLENSCSRDLSAQTASLFFLSAVAFIFRLEWWAMPWLLTLLVVNAAAAMSLASPEKISRQLIASFKAVACAAPVALLLFAALPRFNPFWQMPGADRAATGLGENVGFESIKSLAQDRSVAFRVSFEGDIPGERYFTSMYYPAYDYKTGSFTLGGGIVSFEARIPPLGSDMNPYRRGMDYGAGLIYRVFMEPSQRRWIPAIEHSGSDSTLAVYSPLGTWLDRMPITNPRFYEFKRLDQYQDFIDSRSLPSAELEGERSRALLFTGPKRHNPKTKELAQKLAGESRNQTEIAQKAMHLFKNGFRYTLDPVARNPASFDRVDEFLFFDRNGYCNHYSAALAFLLRAAGIRAMVAGGFLAGEETGEGEERHVLFRNSDAHSWVKAHIDGKWTRLDPVSLVEPDRIFAPFDDVIAAKTGGYAVLSAPNGGFGKWLEGISEQISFAWSRFVLNYSFGGDSGTLAGFVRENSLVAGLGIIALCGLIILAVLGISKKIASRDRRPGYVRVYAEYARALEQIGIKRDVSDTPAALLAKTEAKLGKHEACALLRSITAKLEEAMYQDGGAKSLLAAEKFLMSRLGAFKKALKPVAERRKKLGRRLGR